MPELKQIHIFCIKFASLISVEFLFQLESHLFATVFLLATGRLFCMPLSLCSFGIPVGALSSANPETRDVYS